MDRTRAIAQRQSIAASAAAELLASLASRASDAFSDRTTLVGSLSAAQASSSVGEGGQAKPATSSTVAHNSASFFVEVLAKVSLPAAASLSSATLAKVAASYAEGSRSHLPT